MEPQPSRAHGAVPRRLLATLSGFGVTASSRPCCSEPPALGAMALLFSSSGSHHELMSSFYLGHLGILAMSVLWNSINDKTNVFRTPFYICGYTVNREHHVSYGPFSSRENALQTSRGQDAFSLNTQILTGISEYFLNEEAVGSEER